MQVLSAAVQLFLQKLNRRERMCRGSLDTIQSGMVTSASLLGAVIGSAIAIFLRDKIGRKFELLLAAGCYGRVPNSALMQDFPLTLMKVLCASLQG